MTGTERIDAELKKRGLSRRGLAIKAGIPPSSFQSAMERNDGWSYGMLVKIAAALNMNIDRLIAIIQGSEHSETQDKTTGALIRAERRKAGMTQAGLAEKSGLSVMSIRRYEAGERVITNAPIVHDDMDGENEIVFHGLTARWRDPVGLYGSPMCSNCGSGAAMKTRFCPHCGAKMEGVA